MIGISTASVARRISSRVLARTDVVVLNGGKVRDRFAEAFGAERHEVLERGRVVTDLLLEEREHDDGGRAVVLEAADGVETFRQGRRRGHQRILEGQAHVAGRQIHGGLLRC